MILITINLKRFFDFVKIFDDVTIIDLLKNVELKIEHNCVFDNVNTQRIDNERQNKN